MIKYEKMSLFDAPKDSHIMHAGNCKGVWGSGIAKEFKARFPKSFEDYHNYCKSHKFGINAAGSYTMHSENDYHVTTILTSVGYADTKSTVEEILHFTSLSLISLLQYLSNIGIKEIYCNRFNSGLFAVPWQKTESVIKLVSEAYNIDFIVCDPNLGSSSV